MSKMALSYPLTNGTYSYRYRDTGGAWSESLLFSGGVNEPTVDFVSPVCDELRVLATVPFGETCDRVHICGLRITEGLQFHLPGFAVSDPAIAQAVYQYPPTLHRETFRFAETIGNAFELTITGIDQRQLQFRQLVFAKVGYEPEENFIFSSPRSVADTYTEQRTGGSAYAFLDETLGGDTLNFRENSDRDYRALQHFIDHRLTNRYCLFERDTSSNDWLDTYMARAQMSAVTPTHLNLNNFDLALTEAFA